MRLSRAGEQAPLWVVAASQSSGRGRRGRAWSSPPGNLFASLLVRVETGPQRAALLGLAAALAVYDAIISCAPQLAERLSLKWPNDVLADGAKLAGILLEAESRGEQATDLVIGHGVNCLWHPDGLPYPAASLRGLGAEVTPGNLFHALSDSWADWLLTWQRPDGFAVIRERWLDHAAGIGSLITVRLPDAEMTGVFEDLDRQGRIILRRDDGTRHIIGFGEVFLGSPASD